MNIQYTQASAGSGKTTSIERTVADKLKTGEVQPSEIIAVTFTVDAAAELKDRICEELLRQDEPLLAVGMLNARIGTVHSIFGQMITDFAFELGLSPNQRVLDENDKFHVLSEALDKALDSQQINYINSLSEKLSIEDWREDIKNIVGLMRSNNFSSDLLEVFADESIDLLNKILPPVDNQVTVESFQSEIRASVSSAKLLDKPTKGLSEAIKECEDILSQSNLKWQSWVKISKLKPTKMGEQAFSGAISIGSEVLKSPNFRKDMFDFIRNIMQSAKLVMSEFEAIKKSRGLIDFVDQEVLALSALKIPGVMARIKEEIRYLIVDEFQDTSPIQLTLFSKMSSLVDEVLLVGDAKQAIYGFRGSDPQLVLNVLSYVQSGGGKVSTLDGSYRSRPGLVALCNELFTKPFSALLSHEQIQLKPRRIDTLISAELGWWTLKCSGRKSKERLQAALAEGIRAHLNSGVEVYDKVLKCNRKVQWKDIAVLCRTNTDAATLASCCARIGIPVSLERSGLVETAEISLVLACVRRLIDPSDSLASAEIISLSTGKTPENWLEERLNAVENNKHYEWNDDANPVLKKLAQARKHISVLSTKETIDLAVLVADVYGIVSTWQEDTKLTDHRLANLAKLSSLVIDYEIHCQSQFLAATPAGFILWLKNVEQDKKDLQAPNPGDAITIATYHSSKGLEWPIVICNSLDTQLKVSIYGARVKASAEKFDWTNPLNDRSISYLPNPFPYQRGNDALSTVLQSTDEWITAEDLARNEAIQLMYVGMTRARDQVVFASVGDEADVGDWLKLLDSNILPPETGVLQLPSGAKINVENKTFAEIEEPLHASSKKKRHWITRKPLLNSLIGIPFYRPASKEAPIDGVICNIAHDFASRININGNVEMDRVGVLLHHSLSLLLKNPEIDKKIIDDLINHFSPGVIQTEQVVNRCKELTEWIDMKFPGAILHTEMPFTHQSKDGSLRQGSIDLLVETKDGWIVIDHKSNPQPSNKWIEIAGQYSGQLSAYKDALMKLSNKSVIGTYLHFSVSGGLVELSIS